MKKILFLILLFSINANSQTQGMDKIDSNKLNSWKPKNIVDYSGVYYFGISESESELRIFITDNIICAQLMTYHWSNEFMGFITDYENLKNVKIIGGKFISNKSNGEFMEYRGENGYSIGILIDTPWSFEGQNEKEFGSRLPDKDVYLTGDFPQASQKILKYDSINQLKLDHLKIMRNEIFARYDYKFIVGGEMDKYFSNKKWYHRINENVDKWLTEIEKKNISLIKEIEKEKNG